MLLEGRDQLRAYSAISRGIIDSIIWTEDVPSRPKV